MISRDLSPREDEIVQLCVEGLTNEAIAHRLGLSVGTVNTYWLRIKLKVGGSGRTDTVVRVLQERAERILHKEISEKSVTSVDQSDEDGAKIELGKVRALLNVVRHHVKATLWSTDDRLRIQNVLEYRPLDHSTGLSWVLGETIYDLFHTTNPAHPGVAAHLGALLGRDTQALLPGDLRLKVVPLWQDDEVVGCIGVMNGAECQDC